MTGEPAGEGRDALLRRIEELELRLQDGEETLDAIRRGEVDALVVGGPVEEHRVYTLATADRPYRVLVEQMQEGAVTLGEDGTVLYCNRRLAGMLGLAQERVIGQPLRPLVVPEARDAFDRLFAEARHAVARGELALLTAGGPPVPVYLSLSLLRDDADATLLCGVLTDLTEQKLHLGELAGANARLVAEIAEREQVEEALRQSQKMEAVGQLTGGIAHDFNNLLTGITGALDLMSRRMAQGRTRDVERYVGLALASAQRAATLTHRLLAFSRRQPLDPKPVDGNGLIGAMEELLRRTLGETVSLDLALAPELWATLCDPHQLENALLNLCINARDAMPDGGRLTVATGNESVGEGHDPDLRPGPYVVFRVADTGTGMTSEVIARAFDPFFTTKPIGQGTGLGLSMIYGFARQSGGQVRVDSEVGRGTTMRLYLPRHLGQAEHADAAKEGDVAPRATAGETVLVVDDEPTVRMLVREVLEELGYAAVEAADGPSGLVVLRSNARIDLLVTDVGLPGGMNGRQVADAARDLRPGLKVLFITGYADTAAVGDGVLEPGMHLLTKPFAMDDLAGRVRGLIEGP